MKYHYVFLRSLAATAFSAAVPFATFGQVELQGGKARPDYPFTTATGPLSTTSLRGQRDPTLPGPSMQNWINDFAVKPTHGAAIPTEPVLGLVRFKVQSSDTNDTPAHIREYHKPKPGERLVELAELRQASFGEVARSLGQHTGMNIAPSASAQAKNISIYLRNLPAFQVLETICNANGLWIRSDDEFGILQVFTVQEFRRDLGSFRDETTEVFTLLYPNAFDIANSIADLFGNRVEVSLNENDQILSAELQQRLDRFDIMDHRASGLTSATSGGSTGGMGSAGGSLRGGMPRGMMSGQGFGHTAGGFGRGSNPLRPSPPNNEAERIKAQNEVLTADQIQKVVDAAATGEADTTAQVAESIQTTTGQRVTIHVTVLRRQNKLLIRSADKGAMREIRDLVQKLDVPSAMVLLDLRVLRIQLGDGLTRAFDYSMDDRNPSFGFNGSFNQGEIAPPIPPNFNPGGAGFNADNFVFQYLGSRVRARLNLLESKNRVESVSNPTMLVANNEVSRVFVGEEIPITTGFTAGTAALNANGVAIGSSIVPKTEVRPVGTTLLLTPNINSDRTVTIRLVQETSALKIGGASIPFPDGGGFRNFPVDIVATRSISGTFIGKHAESFLVGGLIEDENSVRQSGVPYISRIPILGAAFRRDLKVKGRTELVLICRPFVIATPSEGEAISREVSREIALNPRAWNLGTGRVGINSYKTNDISPAPTIKQRSRQIKDKAKVPFGAP